VSAEEASGPSEFERLVRSDRLPAKPLVLAANEAEKSALAERFGLSSLSNLEAHVTLEPEGLDHSGPFRCVAGRAGRPDFCA